MLDEQEYVALCNAWPGAGDVECMGAPVSGCSGGNAYQVCAAAG
jgi:hypothetical protein